jgi:hypothetical protein
MWFRFVNERPVSIVTIDFLTWCSARMAAPGCTAMCLIWDNASWHRRHTVRRWLRPHHRQVKRGTAGGRIVASQLPNKSPWPNPMEPKWVHGTRVVSEADRLLSAAAQEARVCTSYGCRCDREAHLVIPKKVA